MTLHTVVDSYVNINVIYRISKLETTLQYNVAILFEIDHGKFQRFNIDSDPKFSPLPKNDFNLLNLKIPMKKSSMTF